MMFMWCICLAIRGICSPILTPGADVSIGLNGPPFLSLSGLRSQISRWLGPPDIQSTMQLLFVLRTCWALASSELKNWIAGTPSAVDARCPSQWRRLIWPKGNEFSDMRSILRLVVEDEFVGIQQSPKEVFVNAKGIGV